MPCPVLCRCQDLSVERLVRYSQFQGLAVACLPDFVGTKLVSCLRFQVIFIQRPWVRLYIPATQELAGHKHKQQHVQSVSCCDHLHTHLACETYPTGHEPEKHSHKLATAGSKTQTMHRHIRLWHIFSHQTDQQCHHKPIIGMSCYPDVTTLVHWA